MRVCKIFEFDAAHNLPAHKGKCRNLHGHRWKVEVEVRGEIQKLGEMTGMVTDFGAIKDIGEAVINQLDHHYLNDIINVPTAENIATWIANELRGFLKVEIVRVWETPTSYAEWRRSEDGL